jgi:hypothetical protein
MSFDFASLEHEIAAATRLAFDDFTRAHPEEPPCAFALYSDDGAETVCPAFDVATRRDARIAKYPEEPDVYTFCTPEWAFERFAGERFTAICTTVSAHGRKLDDEQLAAFKESLFESCIRVLERLRAEGAFDAYPSLLLMFDASDCDLNTEDQLRTMTRLNAGLPWVEQYYRWAKTWAE